MTNPDAGNPAFQRGMYSVGIETDIASPEDGDVVTFDAGAGKFKNKPAQGGTSGQGLPPVNRSLGASGGFGVEIIATQVIPAGTTTNPTWDAAFTLDPLSVTNPTTSAVDNSYMKWDPLTPAIMQIKQAGWYIQGWEFSFSAAPDGNVLFQPGDMSVASGPGTVMIPGGAGSGAFQTYSTLVYIRDNGTNVDFNPMDIHPFGATDLTLTDCQIVFVPLFTIA